MIRASVVSGLVVGALVGCGSKHSSAPTEDGEGGAGVAGSSLVGGSESSHVGGGGGGADGVAGTAAGATSGTEAGGGGAAGAPVGGVGGAAGSDGIGGGTGSGGAGGAAGSSGAAGSTAGEGGGPALRDCQGVASGSSESRIRFAVASAPTAIECQPETQHRTCGDGTWTAWSGTFAFDACTVNGCPALPETRVRFAQSEVDYPATCVPETQFRSCTNGVSGAWSGSFTQESCVIKIKNCGAIAHGSSEIATRYREAQVPFGGQCEGEVQSRLCINGQFQPWTGSFKADSCSVTPPAKCDGSNHGAVEERVRYAQALVDHAFDCSAETQSRTCSNGAWSSWSGSPAFAQTSCHAKVQGYCTEDEQCLDGVCQGSSCACPAHQEVTTCSATTCCKCSGKWQGDSCQTCPGNWDSQKDCSNCRNHWTDNDCGRCPAQFSAASDCAACSDGWSGPSCEEQAVCVRFVDPETKASIQTGYSWGEAFQNIGFALSSIRQRACQIWVREGTYSEQLSLSPLAAIYGGFSGKEKTLSQRDPALHRVILKGTVNGGGSLDGVAFLDEVTGSSPLVVRNAQFQARLVAYDQVVVEDSSFENVRGAVYVNDAADLTVRRSRFLGVYGMWGSAVDLYGGSHVRLEDTLVQGSTPAISLFRVDGGSQLELVSSVVSDNQVIANAGELFGVRDGLLRIVNSTIAGNSAKEGVLRSATIGVGPTGDVEVVNSILWSNPAPLTSLSTGSTLAMTYSIVEGGFAGSGNLASTPQFLGSGAHPYRLFGSSPGVDAADGGSAPTHDLLGATRLDVTSVPNTGIGNPSFADMGAYEVH